ncbi:MAG: hypothetical protein IJZ55_13550 [Lachnospiraceae bacterium]|nr:hypothetical protein [Lachnospiraceae bacterium]
MRELEECKKEVFRRSNERIKMRRKKRQRAMVCCTSLCVLLVAGVVIPRLGPVDELFINRSDGAEKSAAPAYAYVKCAKEGSVFQTLDRITEKEAAKDSYDMVVGLFVIEEEYTAKDDAVEDTAKDYQSGVSEGTEDTDRDTAGTVAKDTTTGKINYQMGENATGDDATYGSTEQATIYEFVFQMEAGKEAEFRLSGNELTDRTNDRKIILTEEQLQMLKTQFGIEEEKE